MEQCDKDIIVQMLKEASEALADVPCARELQCSKIVDGMTGARKRQAAPHAHDGLACKRARSRADVTSFAAPDFLALAAKHDYLRPFVSESKGKGVLDFRDWNAVHALARAHLQEAFDVHGWSVPPGHLVPAIPNRLSYILWINDLLQLSDRGMCQLFLFYLNVRY